MSKRLFIIAGEASGDLHGANLIKALKSESADVEVEGWGGDLMESAGMRLHKHYRDLAFMGFVEVILNIRIILRNFKHCKAQIEEFKPDAVILIDYPGFNLRMAKWIHEKKIKVLYYISPQIWAWKQNRAEKIKAYVDEMFTILPFEKEFYKKFDISVNYVGHPLLDAIDREEISENFKKKNNLSDQPILALLPGSRTQEINRMLAVMISAANNFNSYQLVIAGAPGKKYEDYEKFLNERVKVVFDQTYDLFKVAKAGWVTSGTATLEAALHKMPQVVVYKASSISYRLAKMLIKVKFISLVNLIMDKEIVKELIQHEANPDRLKSEMDLILKNEEHLRKMLDEYEKLIQVLGGSGASEKTAKLMLKTIGNR